MAGLAKYQQTLAKHANQAQAKVLQRFFKTDPGQYGAGDIFLGIKVPIQREIAKHYSKLTLAELQQLLGSKIHEHRLGALFILIAQYQKGDNKIKSRIFKFYLKNSKQINNWDLVDSSAPNIVGDFLLNKSKATIYKLARSNNLWEKRISIIATFTFIRNNDFKDTLKIAKLLLSDSHDLIHKAVGWMLREVGKRDQSVEEQFLEKYSTKMPRTMLRYAIEKFSENKRKYYLARK